MQAKKQQNFYPIFGPPRFLFLNVHAQRKRHRVNKTLYEQACSGRGYARVLPRPGQEVDERWDGDRLRRRVDFYI